MGMQGPRSIDDDMYDVCVMHMCIISGIRSTDEGAMGISRNDTSKLRGYLPRI